MTKKLVILLSIAMTGMVYTVFIAWIMLNVQAEVQEARQSGYELAQSTREQEVVTIGNYYFEMPLYLQTDPIWKDTGYSEGTIETYGCGLTDLAMMLTKLLGFPVYPNDLVKHQDMFLEADVNNPDAMCRWASDAYHLTWSGERWGFEENIDQMLSEGYIVMCSMQGKLGDREYEGHVILVYGIVDGCYLVRDPADGDNSVRLFRMEDFSGVTWGALNGLKV